jgi:hypothetical protein
MSSTVIERFLFAGLLALVAGICLARGAGLASDPQRLNAHEERIWMQWAYPRSDLPALFGRVAAGLGPDRVICLQISRNLGPVERFQYLANYYLVDQRVAAIRLRGARRSFPPQATVVRIDWQGEVEVERGSGGG